MTVEERARKLATTWERLPDDLKHNPNVGELIFTWSLDALRDQIEECAEIVDEQIKWADNHEEQAVKNPSFLMPIGRPLNVLQWGMAKVSAEIIAKRIRALAAPVESKQEKGD